MPSLPSSPNIVSLPKAPATSQVTCAVVQNRVDGPGRAGSWVRDTVAFGGTAAVALQVVGLAAAGHEVPAVLAPQHVHAGATGDPVVAEPVRGRGGEHAA